MCISPQEQLPDGGITCTCSDECSRKGQDISDFLQQTFLSSKIQQVEIYPRSELTEQKPKNREIQNGDTRVHKEFFVKM